MDLSVLASFRLTVAEKKLGIYGIRVERKDGDALTHFWRADEEVHLFSGSKTFTSLAVGMCVDDGKLKVTDRALDFFPEYRTAAAPGSEEITVRDLLHMMSGKLQFWFGELDGEMNEKDWAELFFRVPLKERPGSKFFYSNACTYMLGRIVEKISGKNVRDFLLDRLFRPLSIFNPQWHTDPQGHSLGAVGLHLTLEEFSRLGTLLLHQGEHHGKRLISETYLYSMVNDTIEPAIPGNDDPECLAGYGYQVWRCTAPGTFRADGKYGQFCILLPEQEAAVTITAHEEKSPYEMVRAVLEEIAPRL